MDYLHHKHQIVRCTHPEHTHTLTIRLHIIKTTANIMLGFSTVNSSCREALAESRQWHGWCGDVGDHGGSLLFKPESHTRSHPPTPQLLVGLGWKLPFVSSWVRKWLEVHPRKTMVGQLNKFICWECREWQQNADF